MTTQNSIIGNHQHNIVLTLICSPFLYLVNLNCYGWSATWFNIALTTFSLPEYEARWRAVRSEWEEPWDWTWTPKVIRFEVSKCKQFFCSTVNKTNQIQRRAQQWGHSRGALAARLKSQKIALKTIQRNLWCCGVGRDVFEKLPCDLLLTEVCRNVQCSHSWLRGNSWICHWHDCLQFLSGRLIVGFVKIWKYHRF